MALRSFYKEIKGKKVTEIPEFVKPMFSFAYLKNSVKRGLDSYREKYIETDSIKPLLHVLYGGMIFSYLEVLPNQRRHLAHKHHH